MGFPNGSRSGDRDRQRVTGRGEDGDRSGLTPEAAFAALGNETRVAIVETLWQHWHGGPIPFSRLRKAVGLRDAGRFNYHVSKLRDHFVRRSDDGYELTPAGFKIAQSVVAGTGLDTARVDATTLESDCPRCGAVVELTYSDGMLRVYCTSCEGFWRDEDEYGDIATGYLFGWEFPSAGIEDRSPDEILEAALTQLFVRTASLRSGVCPDCGGRATGSLSVCPDHDPIDGICPACNRYFLGVTGWECRTCKLRFGAPSWAVAVIMPRVRSTLVAKGVEYSDDPWEVANMGYLQGWTEELAAIDPPSLALHVPTDEGEHVLRFDETGAVVEGLTGAPG